MQGPAAGLKLLEDLDEPLAGHHRLHAARAHMLEMSGRVEDAIDEYETAAKRTASVPERDHLTTQAARLNAARSGGVRTSASSPHRAAT